MGLFDSLYRPKGIGMDLDPSLDPSMVQMPGPLQSLADVTPQVDPSLNPSLLQMPAPRQQGVFSNLMTKLADPRVRSMLAGISENLIAAGQPTEGPFGKSGLDVLAAGVTGANKGLQSYTDMIAKQRADEINRKIKEAELRKMTAESRDLERKASGATAFQGQGLDNQAWNILLDPNTDPTSELAQTAYSIVSQAKSSFDPTTGQVVSVTPQIPASIANRYGPPKQGGDGEQQPPAVGETVGGVKTEKVGPGTIDQQMAARKEEAERKTEDDRRKEATDLNSKMLGEIKPLKDQLRNISGTRTLLQQGSGVALAGAVQRVQKLFDDGVVREEDIARISGTSGVMGSLQGAIERASTGAPIPAAVRNQLAAVLDAIERQINMDVQSIEGTYIENANTRGLDQDLVLGRKTKKPQAAPPKAEGRPPMKL